MGLDALRRAVNPGLKALLEVAQISAKRPPTSGEVGFRNRSTDKAHGQPAVGLFVSGRSAAYNEGAIARVGAAP